MSIEETLAAILAALKSIDSKFYVVTVTDKIEAPATQYPPTTPYPQVEAPTIEAPKVKADKPKAPEVEQPSREKIGTDLISLATEKGRDAAIGVLANFGAKKLAELKVTDYTAFEAAIAEARQ